MTNTARIAELKAEIAKLEEAERVLATMGPEHRVAISLHKMLCHHNHTDGCGWEYEMAGGNHEWEGHAHARYLIKAKKLVGFCKRHHVAEDTAIQLIEEMQGY